MAGTGGSSGSEESSRVHATEERDIEPLIDGSEDPRSGFKHAFKGFFSRFKGAFASTERSNETEAAEPSEEPSSSSAHSEEADLEAGNMHRESSAQSLTHENRCTEGQGTTGFLRHGSSQSLNRASPHASTESSSSNNGLLNNLWRLGEAAIPQPSRNSTVNATCLICLEALAAEEFASGEAIVLDCECRGDVAMRHRACVEKWTHVKGNRTCDICKTLIKNLPDPPPRAPETASSNGPFDDAELLRNNAQFIVDQAPTGTDVVFDCIRVTWIAMIISILFFGMDIANALWTGAIVGLGYTICVRAMYQYQLRMYLREQQRERDVEEGQPPAPVVI